MQRRKSGGGGSTYLLLPSSETRGLFNLAFNPHSCSLPTSVPPLRCCTLLLLLLKYVKEYKKHYTMLLIRMQPAAADCIIFWEHSCAADAVPLLSVSCTHFADFGSITG